MKIMLDTNVLVDLFAKRQPWLADAQKIRKRIRSGVDIGYVSASTVTDIFYLVHRNLDIGTAFSAIRLCSQDFVICTIDENTINDALKLPGNDFEDNIVIACAQSYALDAIITRNPKDFRHSPIPVYTPADWLAANSQI